MPTDAEIDAALDAVIVAARAHRALLRAGDRTSEQAVARAYVALNNATVRYDDLLSEAYDEVTPWDVELMEGDPEPEAVPQRPLPEAGPTLIAVRQRRDYHVPDIDALLRLGSKIRVKNWSDHEPEHASTPVTDLGEAVYELVLAGDGSLAALDSYPQLVPGNGVLLINAVERGLAVVESPHGEDDEPFRLLPTDPLLYRLDEEVVDDADQDAGVEWDNDSDEEWETDRVSVARGRR